MGITIYLANIEPVCNNAELFEKIYSTLPDYRKKKIDSLKFHKDKCLSLGVGYLLKKAVCDFGYADLDFEVVFGEHKKPYFKNQSDLFFNLSHSENMVMCAISDYEIGCDIQFESKNFTPKSVSKFFSESEAFQISKLTDAKAQTDMFFRLWTLRESFVKCIGDGFSNLSGLFSVSLTNGITQNFSNSNFAMYEIDAPQGYKCSCVAKDYFGSTPRVIFVNIAN